MCVKEKIKGIGEYVIYESLDDRFGFVFDYPSNWYVSDSISEYGLPHIHIIGPWDSRKTMNCGLSAGIEPSEFESYKVKVEDGKIVDRTPIPIKEKFKTLDEYVPYKISMATFKKREILSKEKIKILNFKAQEVTAKSNIPQVRGLVRGKIIQKIILLIFQKDNYFFTLKYSATKEDFDKYLPAYERMKESFKFLE